jgi:hypothetical protein
LTRKAGWGGAGERVFTYLFYVYGTIQVARRMFVVLFVLFDDFQINVKHMKPNISQQMPPYQSQFNNTFKVPMSHFPLQCFCMFLCSHVPIFAIVLSSVVEHSAATVINKQPTPTINTFIIQRSYTQGGAVFRNHKRGSHKPIHNQRTHEQRSRVHIHAYHTESTATGKANQWKQANMFRLV